MKHTFQCHSSIPNFKYSCGVSGCTQTFKTYSAILSHLQRKHEDWTKNQDPVEEAGALQQEEQQEDLDSLNIEEETIISRSELSISPVQRSMAMLLLTLKERHRLTQSALDFCVGQIKEVVGNILDQVKRSVKDCVGEDADIDECFNIHPFGGLETEYLQTKFYRNYFNYVVS